MGCLFDQIGKFWAAVSQLCAPFRNVRRQLQEHDIQGRWSSLREILSVQQRVTASFQRANGGAPAYPQSHASGNGTGGHLPSPESRSFAGRCAKDLRLT